MCLSVFVLSCSGAAEAKTEPKGLLDFRWGDSRAAADTKAKRLGLTNDGSENVGRDIVVLRYEGTVFGMEADVRVGFFENSLFDVAIRFDDASMENFFLIRDALEDLHGGVSTGGANYGGNYGTYGARECYWGIGEVGIYLAMSYDDDLLLQYAHRTKMNKALRGYRSDSRSMREKIKKSLEP